MSKSTISTFELFRNANRKWEADMPKQTTKPPTYRLTLTQPAVAAAIGLTGSKALFRTPKIGVPRSDGKIDVGISYNLLDQLQTAALPKENLSDTLIRLYGPKKPAAPAA